MSDDTVGRIVKLDDRPMKFDAIAGPVTYSVQPCVHESRPVRAWVCDSCSRFTVQKKRKPGQDELRCLKSGVFAGRRVGQRCGGTLIPLVEK